MISRLVHQRIRNRIIENLEWILEPVSDPRKLDFNEMVNSWYDWMDHPIQPDRFPAPAYTANEVSHLRRVLTAMDSFCVATPKVISNNVETLKLPEWKMIQSTARLALLEMMKRGRLPEDD